MMVREALARLADGDTDVRLAPGAAGYDSRVASLFNTLAHELRSASDADAAPRRAGPAIDRADALGGGDGLFCVAILGIEHFLQLRQQIGGAMARRTLKLLQDRITDLVPQAALGRVGRATIEFAIPAADEDDAAEILSRVQDSLEQPVDLEGRHLELATVIGYACGRRDGTGELALYERAEVALDRASAAHLRLAAFGPADEVDTGERLALIHDLGAALSRGEFFLCYQPKLSCRDDKIASIEALIRWRHPERGLIAPDAFIPLAENTGTIRSITRWVIQQSIADQRLLNAAGFPLEVSVNISGRLLADAGFARWALDEIGDAEGTIGFELTETLVIEDQTRAIEHLKMFSDAGIRIAIDDYGSGLSSLAYLKELPARELKVDKLFISGLASSQRDPLLVRSTIDLAHALDMQVTAEGVDSPATLALLRMMGCDQVQGFLIAKPLPIDELQQFLVEHGGRNAAEGATANVFGNTSFWRRA